MTLSSFSPPPSSPFFPQSSYNSTFLSPPLRPSAAATTAAKLIPALCAQASPATPSFSIPSSNSNSNSHDQALIALLRQRKTEEAWQVYSSGPPASIPSSTCLSRLLAQLSYQNTPQSLSRAQSIISRLRHAGQLHRLDSNSLGLLAASAAKSGDTRYANSIIKSMLRSNFLPHVKAWSAVVSRLAASPDDGPIEAIRLFYAVTRRVRRLDLAGDSRPDTAAFNAVLNACANAGDVKKFCQVFDEMPQWNVAPDVLTYNVLIKLCGRAGRKDLLVSVLEMLMVKGIQPCATTFHSLVAAYVGFADLDTAEKLVQAMRDGRRDVCQILRDANLKTSDKKEENSDEEDDYDDDDDVEEEEEEVKHVNGTENNEFLDKLIPIAVKEDGFVPPLLPKEYAPDSRIYTTLMKGYMKAGRISDTVRTLEAMRHQKDTSSHPDHVSYTTVISAFVKAGSMDRARQVLAEMTRVGVPANRVTYNILLKGYCHQLQIERAKELVKEMTKAEILPDVVSYNTLIDGCILAEDSSGALNYFNEMRARGLAPTKISYTTLMKAFALSGQPNLASKVFDEMLKDRRVKVDQVAWNMLVESYCKLGLIEEAKKVVEKMREHGFYPNVATYGSLANGIAVARKPGEALLLWKEVKERCKARKKEEESSDETPLPPPPIEPDEGLLDTLADICVRAAFFKKALEIGACMEEYGISPNKTKLGRIYVEMHSRMFTSKHASQARQDKRKERKRAAEAFKFWLGLPNNYYSSDWTMFPRDNADDSWKN